MKNLDKFEELSNQFRDKLLEKNQQNDTILNTTSNDFLSDKYSSIIKLTQKIKKIYPNLMSMKMKVGDTFLQLLCYLIYLDKIDSSIDEYYTLSKFINDLFSKNSKLEQLLDKLEQYLTIYKATDNNKENIKSQILDLLNELNYIVKETLNELKILQSDGDNTISVDEDGNVNVTSTIARNVLMNFNELEQASSDNVILFKLYNGFTNRDNYIAQKSYINIKKSLSHKEGLKEIFVTSPGLNLNNTIFYNDAYSLFFNIFNIYDYVNKSLVEITEPTEDVSTPYTTKTSTIRFGSLLSPTDITDDPEQSIMINNGNNDFINGKIYSGKTYKITNLQIEAKFKNNGITADQLNSSYSLTGDNKKFSDELLLSIQVTNESNSYFIKGNLVYNEDLTKKRNDEQNTINNAIKDNSDLSEFIGVLGSYYTGKLQISNENEDDANKENSNPIFLSKDVIFKIEYNDDKTINIKSELDTTSSTSKAFEENEILKEEPNLINAMSTICLKNLQITNKIFIQDTETKLLTSLLGISSLDIDNENFDFIFGKLMGEYLNSKNEIINVIVNRAKNIAALSTSVSNISSSLSQKDATFDKEYTKELVSNFIKINTDLMPYFSKEYTSLKEELYNGAVYNKLQLDINKIHENMQNILNDILLADKKIYDENKKIRTFCLIGNNQRVSLFSAVNAIYNILTLSDSNVNLIQNPGIELIKINIMPFSKWNSYFDMIPNGEKKSYLYFIDDFTKCILYCLSQLNDYYNHSSKEYTIINKYLKILLLRQLEENICNPQYKQIYQDSVFSIIESYNKLNKKYTIDLSNINSDFLNPYIVELFKESNKLNFYDLSQINITDINNMATPLIYLDILKSSSINDADNKIQKIWDFLNNGQTLNFRELLFKISLLLVYKTLKNNQISGFISLDNIDIDNEITLLKNIILILINYYNLYNGTDSYLKLLKKNNNELYNIVNEITITKDKSVKTITTYNLDLPDLLLGQIHSKDILNDLREEESGGTA